jgi:hypothetical protein
VVVSEQVPDVLLVFVKVVVNETEDSDPVLEKLADPETEFDPEAEEEMAPEPLADRVLLPVQEPLNDRVPVKDCDTVNVIDSDLVVVLEIVRVPVPEAVAVGAAVGEVLTVTVFDRDEVSGAEPVAVLVFVSVPEPVGEVTEFVSVSDSETVLVADGDREPGCDKVLERVAVLLRVWLTVREVVTVEEILLVSDWLLVTVADGEINTDCVLDALVAVTEPVPGVLETLVSVADPAIDWVTLLEPVVKDSDVVDELEKIEVAVREAVCETVPEFDVE